MLLFALLLINVYFTQISCEIRVYRRLETHYKCRNDYYPETNEQVIRRNVAEEEVSWDTEPFHPPYDPPTYTAKIVLNKPDWADPELDALWLDHKPTWNIHGGPYSRMCGAHVFIINNSCPLNPVGRTGLKGRGLLGRWGPNHAVHTIIGRWKRDKNKRMIHDVKTGKPLFQFIAVKRRDLDLWSIPGRFVEIKEKLLSTLQKCVFYEIFNNFKNYTNIEKNQCLTKMEKFLDDGLLIYKGYVDDPRNTDNAWVSTSAFLFFDHIGNITRNLHFVPGPNITEVKWMDAVDVFKMEFFANHEDFVKDAALDLHAFYPLNYFEKLALKKKKEQELEDENSVVSVKRLSETASSSSTEYQ
ncbi:ADP-ribose pyrophosphatase, mitochondrial isoform X2 [Lycorma delicatula]|uniref:ADP-ribose pyrophosphatase, mitochondrial isoform X2 n=1 Tax=Lycorma delicatula TaxID=130591 RepID=UPI003F514ED7